jgi:hypothetical protein
MPKTGLWQGKVWEGKSFIRSTKAVLVGCIRERGFELSPEGREALDALADDFDSWKADPARRGTPVAPEARTPTVTPPNDRQHGSEKAKGGVRISAVEQLGLQVAIGTDGFQWIVLKRRGERWEAVGYVHSCRRALVDCIEARGLKLSVAGLEAIERQDARIYRWREPDSKPVRRAA